MDPSKAVAAAISSAHTCAACGHPFADEQLRDFSGVPVCVDCYRDLGLLTLEALPARPGDRPGERPGERPDERPDEPLLGALLSAPPGDLAPAARRRYAVLLRFASRLAPEGAEHLVLQAARGTAGSGLQEMLWVLLAADALLRAGGTNGTRPLEGRDLSLLLNLAARVGMDVAWAAMLESGVATRSLDPRGEEWVYEDLVRPGGESIEKLSAEKAAFTDYIRGLKAKVDLLVKDASARRDEIDIPLAIIARTADEILASFQVMEQPPKRPSPRAP